MGCLPSPLRGGRCWRRVPGTVWQGSRCLGHQTPFACPNYNIRWCRALNSHCADVDNQLITLVCMACNGTISLNCSFFRAGLIALLFLWIIYFKTEISSIKEATEFLGSCFLLMYTSIFLIWVGSIFKTNVPYTREVVDILMCNFL